MSFFKSMDTARPSLREALSGGEGRRSNPDMTNDGLPRSPALRESLAMTIFRFLVCRPNISSVKLLRVRGMRNYLALVLSGIFVVVAGCDSLFPSSSSSSTTDPGDGSVQPTLTSGDFPDVDPCLNRDTLPNDETFLETLTNAAQIIHIHDEYLDDDNLPGVCGLNDIDNKLESAEAGWDASAEPNVTICYNPGDNISEYLDEDFEINRPDICRSNFAFENDADEALGFPRAGTYRLDVCLEDSGNTYRVRLRLEVSGNDVNKKLEDISLENYETLEFYDEAANKIDTTEKAKELFTDNPGGFVFIVRTGQGTITHLQVTAQVICVLKQVSACPAPDEECEESE